MLVAVAVAVAVASTSASSATGRARHATCGAGAVSAVIGGENRCLAPRTRCSSRFERAYNRYGFHCHKGVLWRDPWAPLRLRRLHLPAVQPRTPCQRTAAHSVNPSWGIALDDGSPPYPLPFPLGSVTYSPGDLQPNGWLYHKTIWVAPVTMRGPVLVRGRQLDGRHKLRFTTGLVGAFRELRLSFSGHEFSDGWQEALGPRYTLIRARGCYGLQVDGAGFSKVLVFQALISPH
jgi:hypothetical protein